MAVPIKSFEPKFGPYQTVPGELSTTVTVGDGLECDPTNGEWGLRSGAATIATMQGVAAADGVDGDVISIYTMGTFATTNTSGGALFQGEQLSMEDENGVDGGSVADVAGRCMGPLKSNANNGEVWIFISPNAVASL